MTSEAHEYTASLRVFSGSLSADELRNRLGDPTGGYDEGDPVTQRTPNAPVRAQALWSLESTLDRHAPLDQHIGQLLDAVDARRAAISAIREACDISIFCGIFSGEDAQGGFAWEPALSRRLADLALPVIFDLY